MLRKSIARRRMGTTRGMVKLFRLENALGKIRVEIDGYSMGEGRRRT